MAIENAKLLIVRIKNKYDSYENWASSGLVLEAGEIAIAYTSVDVKVDNGTAKHPALLMKVGDGVKTFANLPWLSAKAADVLSVCKNETDGSERGTDLIYASGNSLIEINGGVFEAATPQWTLNVKDVDYKAGKANIIVKGGSFKNFDPANNNAEGANTNFVALGYQSVKEGDYYVVKPL